MTDAQMGAGVALAVIGLFLIVISATARDSIHSGSFGDHLSKIGLFTGGLFMLPLVLMVIVTIVVGATK